MNNKDIRWHQRLYNYEKALAQLNKATALNKERKLSELEMQGLIQSFEITHELAWNVMKDYFYYQGNNEIRGSRDASLQAFKYELINDGEVWMDMILSRYKTNQTYVEKTAKEIVENILIKYVKNFNDFENKMLSIKQKDKNL
jgi:nucleotidyltransferase substrate binding protein (TIGR01987 family)